MHPYCAYVATIKDKSDVDKLYHDKHYGRPIKDDNELFGRLVMEINQAGLSWRTILLKEQGFRKAYHNFDVKKVA
jgi:DNA-3-methyladenine glycosylase I